MALGPAPNYLTAQVVELARARLGLPNMAEALHRAVKSTRYGCTDENTTALSKQAYVLLHNHFGRSRWARLTPYWF